MITIPLTIYPEDKILVLSPHPDDESIGVGGLLALYSKQISVIVMTDGRYGNDRYDAFEMKKIREQEFVNAMEVVGISDYKFIKIEDGLLIENKNVLVILYLIKGKKIKEVIKNGYVSKKRDEKK